MDERLFRLFCLAVGLIQGVPSGEACFTYNCNFERTCQFATGYNGHQDVRWRVNQGGTPSSGTGPTSGYGGSGRYTYMEATDPVKQGDTTWLSLPAAGSRGAVCVEFVYHMLGQHMGRLELYSNDRSVGQSPVAWSMQGSQGQDWIWANVTVILPTSNSQVTFRGTKGSGYQSDIALDSIDVTCGRCDEARVSTTAPHTTAITPATTTKSPTSATGCTDFACDFESICANQSQYSGGNSAIRWRLNSGGTPSTRTGPSAGYGGSGRYIYMETSGSGAGSTWFSIPPSGSSGHVCVQFAYHMYGEQMGSLQLYVSDPVIGSGPVLWQRRGNQSNSWRLAKETVLMPTAQSRLTWLGIRGSGFRSDIGLDEIRVTCGSCDDDACNSYSCDFETTCATQVGYNSSNSAIEWHRHNGSTPSSSTGPSAGFGGQGNYIYMETSGTPNVPGYTWLFIPASGDTGPVCVGFAYHMYGSQMGSLLLYTFDATSGLGSTLWNRTGNQGNAWRTTQLTVLMPTAQSRITWIGIKGSGYLSDIALDDIRVECGPCDGVCQSFFCDFERSCATAVQYTGSNAAIQWRRHTRGTPTPSTGPSSGFGGSGYYNYMETSGTPNVPGTTWLITPAPGYIGPVCVGFAYHMYGSQMGSLRLHVYDPAFGLEPALWSRTGNQGNVWRITNVTAMMRTAQTWVAWLGLKGSGDRSDIGLDEISVRCGACDGSTTTSSTTMSTHFTTSPTVETTTTPSTTMSTHFTISPTVTTTTTSIDVTVDDACNSYSCDFETTCATQVGYNSSNSAIKWRRHNGSTPSSSTGPSAGFGGQGNYIYMETSGAQGDTWLFIPASGDTGPVCVGFAYHMYGSQMGSLLLYTFDAASGLGSTLWNRTGNQGNAWRITKLTVLMPTVQSRIAWNGIKGSGYLSDIALDDIRVECGPCDGVCQSFFCDFERSCATAVQYTGSNAAIQWRRHTRGTPTPSTGPSSGFGGSGYYNYMETSGTPNNPGTTWLITPAPGYIGPVCVGFAYHMYGSQMGSLRLHVYDPAFGLEPALWSRTGNQGNAWRITNVTAMMRTAQSLVAWLGVKGSGDRSDIGLDEISVRCGACGSLPPVCSNSQVLCDNKRQCFDLRYKCDGVTDCDDGSDEEYCPCPGNGDASKFRCGNGRCVSWEVVCDGVDDCRDNSDENYNCSSCSVGYFRCDSRCLPVFRRCDGSIDCSDTSDELSCACPAGEFRCSGYCYSPREICQYNMECLDDLSLDCSNLTSGPAPCGIAAVTPRQYSPFIISGREAIPNSWPWQVSILQYTSDGYWTHVCGGSLITPCWVLTAAHCIVGNVAAMRVRAGIHDRTSTVPFEDTVGVLRFVRHPDYKAGVRANDIALIELSRCLPLSDKIGTVCLPTSDVADRMTCTATGWGETEGTGDSRVLQEVELSVVNQIDCRAVWRGRVNITRSHICVTATRRRGVCHGDSGGPLACKRSGMYEIHGITSFGPGNPSCIEGTLPDVFTRVTTFTGFIRALIPASDTCAKTTTLAECDFEDDFCNFMNDTLTTVGWRRGSGRTPTSNTGPTRGFNNSRHYAYHESSSANKSRLLTPTLCTARGDSLCLSLCYHMFGSAVGKLTVTVGGKPVMTVEGNQGNQWRCRSTFVRSVKRHTWVTFIANSVSRTGDIAIDNIIIRKGKCA